MSWVEFDEVTIVQAGVWVYGDRVPGRLFKVELLQPAAPVTPQKLVVKRWTFDSDGDRLLFGDARAIWVPPVSQALILSSEDPDIDSNAGLAFYLSKRYSAFGVYRCSVWDSPKDMTLVTLVPQSQLDANGEIKIIHNFGTELVNTAVYLSLNNRLTRVSPDSEWSEGDNEYGFSFASYVPYTGFFKILIERK